MIFSEVLPSLIRNLCDTTVVQHAPLGSTRNLSCCWCWAGWVQLQGHLGTVQLRCCELPGSPPWHSATVCRMRCSFDCGHTLMWSEGYCTTVASCGTRCLKHAERWCRNALDISTANFKQRWWRYFQCLFSDCENQLPLQQKFCSCRVIGQHSNNLLQI